MYVSSEFHVDTENANSNLPQYFSWMYNLYVYNINGVGLL